MSDGKIQFTLKIQRSGEQDGTIIQGSTTMQFVAVGESMYVKLDAATIEQKVGRQGAALVGDRWLKGSRENPDFASCKSLTYRHLLDELNKVTGQGGAAPVAGTVNGQPAVTIALSDGERLAMATTGPGYPLQIGRDTDTMSVSSYNAAPEITAPANWTDPAQLKQLAPVVSGLTSDQAHLGPTPAPSSSTPANRSAAQVLSAAQGAFASATSVQVQGWTARTRFTLRLRKSGNLDGTITKGRMIIQFVVVGEWLYVKLDTATTEQKYGAATTRLIGDK